MGLSKRWILVLLLVLAISIAAVSGVVLGNLASASASKGVTITSQGDNRVYSGDDPSIPFKWGTVNIGENTKTITITNNAKVNLKAHLTLASPNLPLGWTLIFSLDNQPIPAGRSVTGTLTLNVPAHTLVGNYNWGASITLNAAK